MQGALSKAIQRIVVEGQRSRLGFSLRLRLVEIQTCGVGERRTYPLICTRFPALPVCISSQSYV